MKSKNIIIFSADSFNMRSGRDGFDHHDIFLIEFQLNGTPAYFYAAYAPDDCFHTSFSNWWKEQNLGSGEIWSIMEEMDSADLVCFNDLYDDASDQYSDYLDDLEDDEIEISLSHFTKRFSRNTNIAVAFILAFQNNSDELQKNYNDQNIANLILESILKIYSSHSDFFSKHIKFDPSFISLLPRSKTLSSYESKILKHNYSFHHNNGALTAL